MAKAMRFVSDNVPEMSKVEQLFDLKKKRDESAEKCKAAVDAENVAQKAAYQAEKDFTAANNELQNALHSLGVENYVSLDHMKRVTASQPE